MENDKYLVAVYGTLCKGGASCTLLTNSDYCGSFDSEPIYDMYSFGIYPVLIKDGSTSIRMEVYEVTQSVYNTIDRIKQIDESDNSLKDYNSELISTPYGEAITYFTNMKVSHKSKVYCGDWHKYKKEIYKEITKNR